MYVHLHSVVLDLYVYTNLYLSFHVAHQFKIEQIVKFISNELVQTYYGSVF